MQNQPEVDMEISYKDKNIALCRDLRNLNKLGKEGVQMTMDCFVLVLVKRGRASVKVNDISHEMQQNDLFACKPQIIVEGAMISPDFDALVFVIAPDYTLNVLKQTQINFSLPLLETTHDVIHLTQSDSDIITHFYDMLELFYKMPHSKYSNMTIDNVLQAMAYKCVDIFESNDCKIQPQQHSSAETIFRDFVLLLHSHNEPIKSVAEYADMLNITPKYFSTICKRIAGKTANKIIEEEIISTAKIMLRNNKYSIKQIAMHLGFANQSHFGSFFRRATGLSPQHYRQAEEEKENS